MNASQRRLIVEAMNWPPLIGPAPKGTDHLLNMYQQAAPHVLAAVPAPWPERIRKAARNALAQGQWLNAKAKSVKEIGTYTETEAIHWCGIFATWMLQKSGVPVTWRNREIVGPSTVIEKINLLTDKDALKSIAAGDICVGGHNQHHRIIIRRVGPGLFLTVEGNVRFQEVLRREMKPGDAQLNTLYRIR